MKAFARSMRIAPKKAAIVAEVVRGLPVLQALDQLRRIHKKAARIIEQLVASAAANAEHNDKQDRGILMIRTIVVNQGAALRRGVPMARGRMRPMQKFMSHISVTLGVAADHDTIGRQQKHQKRRTKQRTAASQQTDNAVKGAPPASGTKKHSKNSSSESSVSSVSSHSSS